MKTTNNQPVGAVEIVPNDEQPTLRDWLVWCETLFIEDALTMSKGNIAAAGRIIGVARNHLSKKIKELGLNANDFKG